MFPRLHNFINKALAALGFTSCAKRELLSLTQQTFRIAIERRAAYAKTCPERHVDFSRYFITEYVDGVPLQRIVAGSIEVADGKLVIADPFYLTEDFTAPFKQALPAGEYPVELALADLGPWSQRVAFVRVLVSDAAVVQWQVAETTDPSGLNQFFGVDAGLASFSNATAAEEFASALRKFSKEHPDGNYYDDVLSREMPSTSNWCNFHPNKASTVNVVITSSGMGDGLYSSYWGLDRNGELAQLVTDFQVFDSSGPIMRT